jgi:hypothetical protein
LGILIHLKLIFISKSIPVLAVVMLVITNIDSIVFHLHKRNSHRQFAPHCISSTLSYVVPAKAEVDTVKVLVKLALLEEEPETISSEVSKVPF